MAVNETSKITWIAIVVALAFGVYGTATGNVKALAVSAFDKIEHIIHPSDTTDDIPSLLGSPMHSGNVSAWNATPTSVLSDVKSMGLNAVTVPVLVDIPSLNSNDAKVNEASLSASKTMIDTMIKNKIKVTVEPYPFVNNGHSGETGLQPPDELAFMANWSAAVKEVAENFKDTDVKGIYIGSNFENLEDQSASFESLIRDLRTFFKGDILYRTNWWYSASWSQESVDHFEKKTKTPFFKDLDMLSIAAYFEVTKGPDDPNPEDDITDVKALKSAFRHTSKWNRGQDLVGDLEKLHSEVGKPIMFGELGIPNYKYAMSRPYHYGYQADDPKNDNIQSAWYQAWLETMSGYDWFKGYSIYSIGDKTAEFYPNDKAQKVLHQLNKD